MKIIPKYRFNYLGYDINSLKLIGHGHEGKVYLLPDDKVLKVFHNPDSCARQTQILLKTQNSRFFPTVFDFDSYSIIMSFVYGSTLSYYLKRNNINKHLSHELVELIDEFKRLHFTKLDIRLGHIYLQPDETVKVIDPRKCYDIVLPYPRSMLKGLKERRVLKDFYNNIKHDHPEHYKLWSKKMT
jgi:RIO-like serine/threonine protein kinase